MFIRLIGSLVIGCILFWASVSDAHLSEKILRCSIFQALHPKGKPNMVASKMMQNGLFSELYDINADGEPDIAMFSPTYGIIEREGDQIEVKHGVGILYELDLPPQDRGPDVVYIDILGNQTCDGFRLYYEIDHNVPHTKEYEGAMVFWDGTDIFTGRDIQ